MSDRSTLRLMVFGVLVISLLGTLLGRLFYLQLVTGDSYRQSAADNGVREIVTPAVRGLVLDQVGRPLVANRTSLVVSVDRTVLERQPDDGVAVLQRLAQALGSDPTELSYRLELCGPRAHRKPPICWNGSPYQPIPVAKDVPTVTALKIMERRTAFPGVQAELEAVREYPEPYGVNGAHLVGYLGPVNEEELAVQKAAASTDPATKLRRNDLIGRAGAEREYDAQLRGKPGVTRLAVDKAGRVTGTLGTVDSTPGSYLVTSLDARLQSVTEKALADAIATARKANDPTTGRNYVADSGAAVVLDVRTGRVLSMASYPTYDPSVWVGGITAKEYNALISKENGLPLTSRAVQGLFAPGSTFKAFSTVGAANSGMGLNSSYQCPNVYRAGDRSFANHESRGYGTISLSRALEVSCNTVFYGIADTMWKSAGGLNAKPTAADPIATAAKSFGLGSRTGIDLPGESRGRVGSRAFKQALWDERHEAWCQAAAAGYPELRKTDPTQANLNTALDRENCTEGFRWREGDALNAAIGQGDTIITPLQLATGYAAIANGGTRWQPMIATALVRSNGKVIKAFTPKATGKVDASPATLAFLRKSLAGVTTDGTGRSPFKGFPLDRLPVASKTGSAQVDGKQSTSWFASFAPANNPRYAVVAMVSEGGTGSGTSGPIVRKIYEALFGVKGQSVNPASGVLVGGQPATTLPKVRSDGTPVVPAGQEGSPKIAAPPAAPAPTAAAVTSSASPGSASAGTGTGAGGPDSSGGFDGAAVVATVSSRAGRPRRGPPGRRGHPPTTPARRP